jgi:hypothetical protein
MTQHRQETRIPVLRFVGVNDLVLHEHHDDTRSAPLAERLRHDGNLKNPPIVAPLGHGDPRYVVLDGANRCTAARMLQLPHLVVQVVDYESPDLELSTWYHAVAACPQDEFMRVLTSVQGVTISDMALLRARAALARREIISYVVWPDGQVSAIEGGYTLAERVTLLNAVVGAYKQYAKIYRTQADHIEEIQQYYDDVVAVVVFPRYEPAEIIEVARNGSRLPAGITRHVIPYRALRINIPLSRLAEAASLEDKNAWLTAWVKQKLANKEMRYYQESTWLFDE